MQTNSGGDTLGVEQAQTIAQERASGVAAEIRRLGEEAYRLGEKIRKEAENFAQEEVKVVADMETHLRKGLSRLRHIEATMRMARTADAAPAIEQQKAKEPEDSVDYGQEESYKGISQSQEEGR
jgi:hypothetical protein